MWKKTQNKVKPQTKPAAESDPSKKKQPAKEQPRPGSAVSREFQPKKQQKAVQNWKKRDSDSTSQSTDENGGQSVNTPFGYVPFKTAPVPIYGSRANPNGNTGNGGSGQRHENLNTQTAINNYVQNMYQQSPQMPRADSVMTATDMHSRPGSELMFRIPSRYQSYTTLPRPEHVPVSVQPIQQPLYGSMIPKATISANHSRNTSVDRTSIYGTAEKRPLSEMSGSNTIRTIQSNYLPRVGSKAALSYYGVPYPDEIYGMKSAISWESIGAVSSFQILIGILLVAVSGAMMFYTISSSPRIFEVLIALLLTVNGVVGLASSIQRNYQLFLISFISSAVNIILACYPIYVGALPFVTGPSQTVITAAEAFQTHQVYFTKELHFALFVLGILAFVTCFINVLIYCKFLGKILLHVETTRLENELNKRAKEIGNIAV